MDKKTLQRRSKAATDLLKRIDRVWKSIGKVPSFTGKAAFMDKILAARTDAHNLEWDLARDLDAYK